MIQTVQMSEQDPFKEIISGGGFDWDETEKSSETIEKGFIVKEVIDEIRGRHMESMIGYTDEETANRYEMYRANLQEALFFRYRYEAARGKLDADTSDEVFDREAEKAAEIETSNLLNFQNRIVESIAEVIYQTRHGYAPSDLTDIKNLSLALTLCEADMEPDNPKAMPYIELYDFMITGDLHEPDSKEFVQYLLLAGQIHASEGEFDSIEDTES